MDDPLLYDWDDLFHGLDFPGKAMGFFQAVGHTITATPLITADDILHCIYSELNFNAYFDRAERSAFACINSLSRLFILDSAAFEKNQKAQVQYYSICLNTDKNERTLIANIIATAFAKNTSEFMVFLFRHDDSCMMSFIKNETSFMIFHSDWFYRSDMPDVLDKIDIANLSLNNCRVFFHDLVYMMARSYYTHPISTDYAFSLLYSQNIVEDFDDESIYFKDKENIKRLSLEHIDQYGDDYIEIPMESDEQTDDFADSDFDLLELEIDEMIASDLLEAEMSEFQEDDLFDESEQTDLDLIPPEVLSNPVELLKWLESYYTTKEKNDETDDKENTWNYA